MRYLPRNEAGEIKNKNALRIVDMFEYKSYGFDSYGDRYEKKEACVITRDKWGKFRVVVDDKSVQHNLNAEEIVIYLANMLQGGK